MNRHYEFGEPWRIKRNRYTIAIIDCHGKLVIPAGQTAMRLADVERIVRCVNALAGVDDLEFFEGSDEDHGWYQSMYETLYELGMISGEYTGEPKRINVGPTFRYLTADVSQCDPRFWWQAQVATDEVFPIPLWSRFDTSNLMHSPEPMAKTESHELPPDKGRHRRVRRVYACRVCGATSERIGSPTKTEVMVCNGRSQRKKEGTQ